MRKSDENCTFDKQSRPRYPGRNGVHIAIAASFEHMTGTQLVIIVLTGVGIVLSVIFSTLLVAKGINNRIDGTNNRFDSTNNRIDGINRRIDSLIKSTNNNGREILEIKGRLSHIHRDISNILFHIKNLEDRAERTELILKDS